MKGKNKNSISPLYPINRKPDYFKIDDKVICHRFFEWMEGIIISIKKEKIITAGFSEYRWGVAVEFKNGEKYAYDLQSSEIAHQQEFEYILNNKDFSRRWVGSAYYYYPHWYNEEEYYRILADIERERKKRGIKL